MSNYKLVFCLNDTDAKVNVIDWQQMTFDDQEDKLNIGLTIAEFLKEKIRNVRGDAPMLMPASNPKQQKLSEVG